MTNSVVVKPDMSWIIANYENPVLEAKAIQETIELCVKQKGRQQVVNDSIQSFREEKVDEMNPVELMAKETLIAVAKSKFLEDEQKVILIQLLVERNYRGYEVDYSYIFDRNVA
jgi:predicted GNAT family acetyltransferase